MHPLIDLYIKWHASNSSLSNIYSKLHKESHKSLSYLKNCMHIINTKLLPDSLSLVRNCWEIGIGHFANFFLFENVFATFFSVFKHFPSMVIARKSKNKVHVWSWSIGNRFSVKIFDRDRIGSKFSDPEQIGIIPNRKKVFETPKNWPPDWSWSVFSDHDQTDRRSISDHRSVRTLSSHWLASDPLVAVKQLFGEPYCID